MNARRLANALAIVERALGVPAPERPAVVAAACGDDVELRREVESLLEAAMKTDDTREDTRARVCPACNRTYDDGVGFCPVDGSALEADSADPEALVGTRLDGVLEVQELLGVGGMGAVYRAYHAELRDQVVVKTIRRELVAQRGFVDRFQQEGQAARRIDHPNAVRVYDLRTTTRPVYMVLEYVEGRTLQSELRERRRYSPAETVALLAPVADAVDAAHAVGIVHRDLKPENIMLSRGADGRPRIKVLDFGIAKMLGGPVDSSLTVVGQPIGTPPYMPPEQWGALPSDGGPAVDGRADVYSLGCIAYELLTGRPPFVSRARDRETYLDELKRAHCQTRPPAAAAIAPDVPAAFSSAVDRALSKDRRDRHPSAGAFVGELAAALGAADRAAVTRAEPESESPPGGAAARPGPAGAAPLRSRRRATLLLAAAAVAIAVAAVALLWGLSNKTVSAVEVASHRVGDAPAAGLAAQSAPDHRVYDAEYSFPTGPPPAGMVYATIGFTVWRTPPASDGATRETVDSHEVAAERIGETLFDGDRVSLCVESLTGDFMPDKGGYLYVINREQYADGSFGPARLIFPTLLTYGGDNRVKPGLPVVLPGSDRPFAIERSSTAHVAENYLVVLSPWEFRLPEPIGPKAMALPASLVADWEKKYGGRMYRATLRSGVGQPRSRREREVTSRATVDTAEPLTRDDPLPQTCYKSAVAVGNPAVFTVSLRFEE